MFAVWNFKRGEEQKKKNIHLWYGLIYISPPIINAFKPLDTHQHKHHPHMLNLRNTSILIADN